MTQKTINHETHEIHEKGQKDCWFFRVFRVFRGSSFFLLTLLFILTKYKVMEPINGNALRGHLESLILSTLEQGEAHGFEIWKRLESAAAGALRLKEGSLYPALYRLEEAGLVQAAWEDDGDRRGPR